MAEIDCRVLTGDDPQEIVEWVRRRIDDDQVEVGVVHPPRHPNRSPTDSPFVLDEAELFRIHGIDEQISLAKVRAGVRAYAELLLAALGA